MTTIRRAALREQRGLWDIRLADDRISAITPAQPEESLNATPDTGSRETSLDAGGRLVTPAFVNPHLHIDKSLLARGMPENQSQTLHEAVERTWAFKAAYTTDDLVARGQEVVQSALQWGTTVIRAFADVDPIVGVKAVAGLLELKRRVEPWMDLQVVAFPQEGILKSPGTEQLMRETLALGADVVGGMPWFEWTDDDMRRHVDIVFDLADAFGRDIHMLVDDTDDPTSRSLEYVAVQTLRRGMQGRVAASHCGALAAYNDVYAAKVIDLVRQANMHIVSNPHISLVMAAHYDHEPMRRGITRVKQLLAAGVNVASGQDDVLDPYYPFGKASQAEVALIAAHVAQLTRPAEIETAFSLVTDAAACVLRLPDYGMRAGCRADLVIHDGTSAQEVLRLGLPPMAVLRRGEVIVRNEYVSHLPAPIASMASRA